MPERELEGQVALVTGASRGIGAAIARRLAVDGAFVFVNDVAPSEAADTVVAEIRETGGEAQTVFADVADAAAVETMFRAVESERGRLDVLANNAGIIKDGLLATMRDKDWQRVLDVNLTGAMMCTRRALRAMMPARRGRIVNTSSIQALRGGRGQANYAAAKAGLLAFTRATALEVADRGIRVNAVLPGFIDTAMTARVKRLGGDQVLEHIPAGRLGLPADVAGVVRFLCSADAEYVTGQGIVVDGGLTIT